MLTWFLNVYDMIVTLIGIYALKAEELNPLMNAALNVGPIFFIASKLSVHAAVCWALDKRLQKFPKRTWATTIVILVLFLIVAVWNTFVLKALL